MTSKTDSPLIGRRLGDFEIVREVGRGGMGVVYEARQLSLNRKVALKVLGGGLGLTPRAVQRFHREAEAAARLHHTNIVPVYATGEQDGTHFYAMELVEGPSLDKLLRQLRQDRAAPEEAASGSDGPLSAGLAATGPYAGEGASSSTSTLSSSSLSSDSHYFDTVARMVADVADALDHAHKNGVIHRDIKPSNLLLAPDGRLSVNDFGLARVLEQPGMTMTGEFVGTPAYMSPEQITAGRVPVDHRTDIYSLGATLYELLTLQPPFAGQRRDQVLAQIIQKEPRAPRRISKKVPVDLETICLKAMDKDPDRRYQTAGQLAEDLRRYVNRFAISARRAGPLERAGKWVRRHPALAGALVCVVAALLAAGFFGLQAHRAHQDRLAADEAHRAKLREEKMERAGRDILQGDFASGEQLIREAEDLGAPEAWAQWRRGQIAYHRGEVEKACELLEPAVAAMPDNVAAKALLASARVWAGRWEEYLAMADAFESYQPRTPEDLLYLGVAEAYLKPEQGLKTLDRAIAQQSSLIAHVLRAQVRADQALETTDVELVKAALRDVTAARSILDDNPSVLNVSVFVHLIAAGLYAQAGQDRERQDVVRQAQEDVDRLDRYSSMPLAVWTRGAFYSFAGKDAEALQVWKEADQRNVRGSLLTVNLAVHLYGQGEWETAVEVLRRSPATPLRNYALSMLLVESPARHEEAFSVYREFARSNPPWWAAAREGFFLLFLGRKKESREAFQAAHVHVQRAPPVARERILPWWEYVKDPTPESEKRYIASGKRSQRKLCDAHFTIGVVRLAEGNRQGAEQAFTASVNTGCFYYSSYEWSRTYLGRMKQDPNWPRWLPAGKAPGE